MMPAAVPVCGEGRRLRRASGAREIGRDAAPPVQRLGEAEVEDLDLAVRGDLDVGGLEVAVDDALLVGLLERLGDLLRDRRAPRRGNRPALQALREVLALAPAPSRGRGRRPTPRARRSRRCWSG